MSTESAKQRKDLAESLSKNVPKPINIQKKSDRSMQIIWSDGSDTEIEFRKLRFECRCAECVDEWTRERRIKLEQIPAGIYPTKIAPVGRYAIQIAWNDGHKTGIYPFDLLYDLTHANS